MPKNSDIESKMIGDAKLIVFSIVTVEYMKLLIKLREYKELYQLCDSVLKRCYADFNLPTDASKGVASMPLPILYIAAYSCRAIAELIK